MSWPIPNVPVIPQPKPAGRHQCKPTDPGDAAFIRFHRRNVIAVAVTLGALALIATIWLSQHLRLSFV